MLNLTLQAEDIPYELFVVDIGQLGGVAGFLLSSETPGCLWIVVHFLQSDFIDDLQIVMGLQITY